MKGKILITPRKHHLTVDQGPIPKGIPTAGASPNIEYRIKASLNDIHQHKVGLEQN